MSCLSRFLLFALSLLLSSCTEGQGAANEKFLSHFEDIKSDRIEFYYKTIFELANQTDVSDSLLFHQLNEPYPCLIRPLFKIPASNNRWFIFYIADSFAVNPEVHLNIYSEKAGSLIGEPLQIAFFEMSNGGEQGISSWVLKEGKETWSIYLQSYSAGINSSGPENKLILEPGPLKKIVFSDSLVRKNVDDNEMKRLSLTIKPQIEMDIAEMR